MRAASVAVLVGLVAMAGAALSSGSAPIRDALLERALGFFQYFSVVAVIMISLLILFGAPGQEAASINQFCFRAALLPLAIVLLARVAPALLWDLLQILTHSLF